MERVVGGSWWRDEDEWVPHDWIDLTGALRRLRRPGDDSTVLEIMDERYEVDDVSQFREVLQVNRTLRELMVGSSRVPWGDKSHVVEAVAEALVQNMTLTTLTVQTCGQCLRPDAILSLGEALRMNITLQRLNVHSSSPGTVRALSAALAKNSGLTSFAVDAAQGIDDQVAVHLSFALMMHPTLTSVELGDLRVGETGLRALDMALRHNSNLSCLALWMATLDQAGAALALSTALAESTTLRSFKLGLGETELTLPVVRLLSKGLMVSKSLTTFELDVQYCDIPADIASSLTDALAANTVLARFALTASVIGIPAARALGQGVARSMALSDFRVTSMGSEDESWNELSEALRGNTSLRSVALRGDFETPVVLRAWCDTLLDNRTLTLLEARGDVAAPGEENDVLQALLQRNRRLQGSAPSHGRPW